ncbi:ribosomal protein S18 [Plectosphaerella cucumerina]|uniref:Small ribosomal subunit protein bS18m n=1 Tax=Plectosphaerella cucumerina TaxID=40658 RepID=A0A8K0TEN5_9PEZI|nr:ribosomal protein S18 [Plectosphaerella cucumerina]
MPPRLPFLGFAAAPSSFINRIARPFSTTTACNAPRDGSDFFLGLEKAASKGAGGAPNARPRTLSFSREKIQARTDIHLNRQRKEAESMRERKVSDDYMKHMYRKWRIGDTYAPHDLHPHQMAKHRTGNKPPRKDVVDELDINPLDLYKNYSMISEFMTPAGNIKHSNESGLRAKNQRKMAKAIRRMIGMGLHPSVHHHPEIIMKRGRTAQF